MRPSAVSAAAKQMRSVHKISERIIRNSLNYIAVPYVWGGMSRAKGFDCSGFVKHIYGQEYLSLPRTSRQMQLQTAFLKPLNVRAADLIFFSMRSPGSRQVDHVGIYLGEGYFIHASTSQGVVVDRLDKPYFQNRLLGIRRHRQLL